MNLFISRITSVEKINSKILIAQNICQLKEVNKIIEKIKQVSSFITRES